MSESSKAAALNRGRQRRRPDGAPSAIPLPPEPQAEAPAPAEPPHRTGRAPDGHGRRGHLRKLSVEMTPAEHDQFKRWLIDAFGGDARGAPVIKALIAEAYTNTALTERVRQRLSQH